VEICVLAKFFTLEADSKACLNRRVISQKQGMRNCQIWAVFEIWFWKSSAGCISCFRTPFRWPRSVW